MTRVWIAQCLCPSRHAILAACAEVEDKNPDAIEELRRELAENIDQMLHAEMLNPWCGICHAPESTWTYEVRQTRWATIAEAEPNLRALEAENIATGIAIGELG